jgi:hypothetical protein
MNEEDFVDNANKGASYWFRRNFYSARGLVWIWDEKELV